MADTTTWVHANRWVTLRGALNFRDIGGYLTRTGAMVAWGRLYRSDSLDELDGDDIRQLVTIGLRTAIDLRSATEHTTTRPDCGIARHELAVFDVVTTEPAYTPGVGLGDVYLHILRQRAPAFRRALEIMAEAPLPLVFHCTAGKDRTGLLAAVVLGVLGVTEGDIARDYALTGAILPALLERVSVRLAAAGIALPPEAHTADADTMRHVLRCIRADHGSMLGYALDVGVDPDAIDTLRHRVLV